MTHFIFIHDFFADGYHDLLSEVHILQACGLWTPEKRASVTKHEVSSYKAARHKFPSLDASYWAGRVAAIKSAATAQYKAPGPKMAFTRLPENALVFCGSCGDQASWQYAPPCNASPVLFRCDACKQEQVRMITAYCMPDGWDWDEHEDELLPVARSSKLVAKEKLEPVTIFAPLTAIIGLGMLDFSLHLPAPLLILQTLFVLHITVNGKEILQAFRTWLSSER